MTTLREVGATLRSLKKELDSTLASDPRCAAMLPSAPRRQALHDAYTRGYYVELGRLGRLIHVELWLDHYSGLASPRAWCGVSCRFPKQLTQLLDVLPSRV